MSRSINFQGIPIYVEYEEGEEKPVSEFWDWGYVQLLPYGYVKNTLSHEVGEALDVFVGKDKESEKVFFASLSYPDDYDSFMGYKVLLGFEERSEAKEFIIEQYFEGMIMGELIEMTIDDFKDQIEITSAAALKDQKKEQEEKRAEDASPVGGDVSQQEQPRLAIMEESKGGPSIVVT